MSLKAIATQLLPAISFKRKQAQAVANQAKVRDLWLVATVMTACIASIAACKYHFFQQHQILLYGDAYSHMRIARGIFDSLTPGLAQIRWCLAAFASYTYDAIYLETIICGGTGLAGSFVAMLCDAPSAVYLFPLRAPLD